MMISQEIKQRLDQLGLVLPEPPKPVGAYKPLVIAGEFGFLSGQISKKFDGTLLRGKLGAELGLEEGTRAAQAAALNVLSVIDRELGFDRLKQVVRLVGYVQCTPEFNDIHKVMNGASEIFEKVFGNPGIHARSAVGMASLPLDSAVEIEATIQIHS